MHLPDGRPRFKKTIPLSPNQAIEAIQAKLAEPLCPCRGDVANLHHHFDLRMHHKDHRLWSPMLSGNISAAESAHATDDSSTSSSESIIHVLVGPNPNIWTAVAFSYLASFTALLFLLTFGSVQLSLGQTPWAFLVGLGILAFATIVWMLSQLGQRLAADQIVILRDVLDDTFAVP